MPRALACTLALLAACDSGGTSPADAGTVDVDALPTNLGRDIVSTGLTIDVAALTGTARIHVAPDPQSRSASFEAKGLSIAGVTDGTQPIPFKVTNGILDVATPPGSSGDVVIDYAFTKHGNFQGLSNNGAYTFIWPYFCSNLFPCHSDPADGTTFELALTGVAATEIAVFPSTIPSPAPSYQIAFAVAKGYAKTDVGTTTAGTHVVFWAAPADVAAAQKGTAHLATIFDHYEKTYGEYHFGSEVGSVAVHWGAGAYGGMEHHPLWHIGIDSLSDELTHAHEAAHGWFGDGVRIACWEDFVLSEGTVNYISAKAIGEVLGDQAEQDAFTEYEAELADALKMPGPKMGRPDGCDVVDALANFTNIPYDKGALFYRALAARIGAGALDGVLHDFYVAHAGTAAHMQDMLDLVKAKTGYDPTACATAWLKTDAAPTGSLATMCP